MKRDVIIVGAVITFIILVSIGCVEEEQRRFGNMKLTSQGFEKGKSIPRNYTCDGADVSPPLTFSSIPESTQSLALVVDDPDAPMGTWVHWLIWNIPPNTTRFSKGENVTFPQGKNDFGNIRYDGPCPPSGTHRYYFKLYALDTMLSLTSGATKNQLVNAMKGHIIEEAELIGTYSR